MKDLESIKELIRSAPEPLRTIFVEKLPAEVRGMISFSAAVEAAALCSIPGLEEHVATCENQDEGHAAIHQLMLGWCNFVKATHVVKAINEEVESRKKIDADELDESES